MLVFHLHLVLVALGEMRPDEVCNMGIGAEFSLANNQLGTDVLHVHVFLLFLLRTAVEAVTYELYERGKDHVLLERARGESK